MCQNDFNLFLALCLQPAAKYWVFTQHSLLLTVMTIRVNFEENPGVSLFCSPYNIFHQTAFQILFKLCSYCLSCLKSLFQCCANPSFRCFFSFFRVKELDMIKKKIHDSGKKTLLDLLIRAKDTCCAASSVFCHSV